MPRMRNTDPRTSQSLPLAGIRVLEFCHTIMGPTAGLILADLGADVIKIEPADGDYDPAAASALPRDFSAPSIATSAASPSISNPTRAARCCIAWRRRADVVLENYAPGTMDRLGCGYADLCRKSIRG